ncbi:hypothetical protein [Oharaeibacter diazotrophicus]|uniref:hypothetical protein n=3 Tax=Oharaeibacter diazotrophicus TaxID=1920512 RepID=UPI001A9845B8|nr:hypothetical protein [Oharaeibacter diazotrophicus]
MSGLFALRRPHGAGGYAASRQSGRPRGPRRRRNGAMMGFSVEGVIGDLATSEDAATSIVVSVDLYLSDTTTTGRAKYLIMSCLRDPRFFGTEYGFYLVSMIAREINEFSADEAEEISRALRSNCANYVSDEWIFSAAEAIGIISDEDRIVVDEDFRKCRLCSDFALVISRKTRGGAH